MHLSCRMSQNHTDEFLHSHGSLNVHLLNEERKEQMNALWDLARDVEKMTKQRFP